MKIIENQLSRKLTLLLILFAALGFGARAQSTALHFDAASNSHLSVPNNLTLFFKTQFTAEMWVKFDQLDAGNMTLFSRNFAGLNDIYELQVSTASPDYKIIFRHQNLRDPVTNTFTFTTEYDWSTLTADTWYHVAVTYDGAFTKIYVDGIEVVRQANAEAFVQAGDLPLFLGRSGSTSRPNDYLDGTLDEVRFWNVARTQTEIQADMNAELSGLESGLIVYHNFEEGIPNADNTMLTNIPDLSGNSNNASFVNFALTGSPGNFVDGSGNGIMIPNSSLALGGGAIIPDTLKVQIDPGDMAVGKIALTNTGVANINWSSTLSDSLGFGNHLTFSKMNFASWQLAENQDRITDNVYITRGDNKSIFNARSETTSSNSVSPADTEWFRGDNKNATTFASFHTMHGGNPTSLVGDTTTVHLITDDEYHEVVFSSYSGGNSGGGFAYVRTPMFDYLSRSGETSGVIAPGNTGILTVQFDATNLKPGLNYGEVVLTTDDPANPTITVVTELLVRGPSSFSLSETVVGDTVAIADAAMTKTFKIVNTGASALTWSTTTAGRPAFMNLVTLDAFSGFVPAGGEATITVTFDAPTFGYYEWPITFTTNDPANPNPTMTITMLANGVPFAVVGSPGVAFDDTFVGYRSTKTLTFNNTGTDTLFVYNAVVDHPDVSLVADSLTILPNSGEQSLELIFDPTEAGMVSGNLTFDTNDPTKLSNSLPFMGTALNPPVIEVNPLSITQAATVNDTVTMQITINNTGGADLNWEVSAALIDAPLIAADPINVSRPGFPSSPDDVISPNVTLTRNAFGYLDFYNKIEVPGNAPADLESTTIRWSPKPTLESVNADYVNSFTTVRSSLGDGFIGSTVSLHLIEEDRYFDLEIISYQTGTFQTGYSYNRRELIRGIGTSVSGGTTSAGGNTQFNVEFYGGALATGTFNGTYAITSNDPLAPSLELPISLTVTGGAADLSTTATSLSAPDTQINQTGNFSLEIINTGNAPLNVSNVTVDDPAFGIGSTSFTIPPFESYQLSLTFSPTLVQAYSATLAIESDDPANSPFNVSLSGNGLGIPEFQLASVLIQDTLASGVTNAKMVRIINNAASDLVWNVAGEVAFEKADNADPNSEAAQDRISDFVWLTRGNERPTYNYLENAVYIPDHTSILYGNGTTFSQPTYGTFAGTFQFGASNQIGNVTSLYLVEEDRYFDLAYTQWTDFAEGGGFAYTRREAVPWLELGSFSGTVAGVGQADVIATFKSNGLAAGDYEFTYDIATNDPVNPMQTVTFQLHVTGQPNLNVTFASDSVRFGNVFIGQTTTLPITVTNTGDSTLVVDDIVFDDPAFTIDQTSFILEAGKNVVLNASFTPSMLATYKAGFTITSNDPIQGSAEFGIRGTGIDGPNLDVNTMTIDLQVVAGGIATADLTLSNSGQQLVDWSVSSKYLAGSEVTFTRASFVDGKLPENQDQISHNVWIARNESGPLFNGFTNNDNFISWAENKTVLSGALPTYEPDISDAFGGGSSMSSIPGNTLSLQLTEEGRFFDVFFNSWASGGGSGNGSGGAFSYTRNELATWLSFSALSGSIGVGGPDQTVTLTADATNLSAGTYPVNLVLASTGVEPTQTVVVNLTVLGAPQIATQSSLDFGNVIASVESSLDVEITNTGNATLNVADLSIDNPVFNVSNSPIAIEPGTSTLVSISFTPSLAQSYAGTLTIANDDSNNSSVSVALSGVGVNPPTATVDVAEINESLFFGASSIQMFNIQNTGSTDLIWSLAADAMANSFVNPNGDAVAFSVDSGVLAAGGSQAVTVTFNPSGSFTGMFELPLQVVSNDPINGRIDVPLSLTIGGITVNNVIADQLEQPGFVSTQFDISGMFTDAQGDALTYTVTSSDASIVTASELSDIVTITEVGTTGTSVISITADDGKGTTETFTFSFRANATPIISSMLADQAYENAFGTANFDLSTIFSDADASDVLTYSVMPDATGIVGVSIANSILTLAEQGPGIVNVTVTANDGFGGQVSDVFEVFVNKINQTITFNALSASTYGDAAIDPGATASSNLTVNYSSSNTAVATASGSTITIVGAGTTTITASQDGDAAYNAAPEAAQTLTINQATLTATADNQSKTYGAANPTLTIGYAGFVNGEDASVLDTAPAANTTADAASNVGTYAITASGGIDNNYVITHVDGTLTVGQASLTATADNQTINSGDALPTFTVSYAGFANGEDASVLDTTPTAGVSITDSSTPGTYDITVSGGADNNYDFTYQNGVLTINQVLGLLNANNIKVYPNPVVNYLEVSSNEVSTIEVFDLKGTMVLSRSVDGKVDLGNLDVGTYMIKLIGTKGEVISTNRIIKQ